MTSEVNEGRNAWGSWRLDWKPNTPAAIRAAADARRNPLSLVRFYGSQIPGEGVGTVPGLFTGILWNSDLNGIGGYGPTWLAGTPGGSIWGPWDEQGPWSVSPIVFDGSTNGSLSDWVSASVYTTESNLIPGSVTGPTTKRAGTITARSLRTILDSFIAPSWGVEWRVNDRFQLDVGPTATLYPVGAKYPLAVKHGGRDASALALQVADLGLTTDWSDFLTRAAIRNGAGTNYIANAGTTIPGPNGVNLRWGAIRGVDTIPAAEAQEQAAAQVARRSLTSSAVITSVEYEVTARVPCGGWIGVYDADAGYWDLTNPLQYLGETIFPVMLRVEAVDWPVQEGMGVWLDRRHRSGDGSDLIDLSPYVEWAPVDAETRITVGTPPATINLDLRRR